MAKSKSKQTTMSAKTLLMILTAFLGGMITVILMYQMKYNAIKQTQTVVTPTQAPEMTFTLEDVAEHNTKEDCWQVIDGVVYNFTEYISSGDHPGGGAMIKDCGTDATEAYQNRPPHSEYATSLLPEYKLGVLVEEAE